MTFNDTIFCFHIPKTAGTSLVAEIGRVGLPWAHIMGGIYSDELGMMVGTGRDYLLAKKDEAFAGVFRIMIGHVTQRDVLAAYGRQERFRYATFLRDPVERLYSEYSYKTRVEAEPYRALYAARYATFGSFVDNFVDSNEMSHYLEEYRGEPASQIFARLVETYAFVGTVENYKEDIARFRRLFGAPDVVPFHLNASPVGSKHITKETVDKIRERNMRDVELYEAFHSRRS